MVRPRYAIDTEAHYQESAVEPGTTFATFRNRHTGAVIDSIRREDKLFVAVCRDHAQASKPSKFRADAERSGKFPQGWCEGCQQIMGITTPEYLPNPNHLDKCVNCKQHRTGIVYYGHLDADGTVPLCAECRRDKRTRERVRKRFSALIKARKEAWKEVKKRKPRANIGDWPDPERERNGDG